MTSDSKPRTAVGVASVSKTFKLPSEINNSVKGLFVSGFKKNKMNKFKVLQDISFDIEEGDFYGIVGRNGSGKSTLLKLLAGIYSPDKGDIRVNGRLTPFIELGVGFNMELTGKENVYLNGALLGFSRKEMSEKYNEIVRFAELEKFMDQKLKNYSSGMQVRLAFSIAIQAESDILLIDEVLAVGDTVFQKKCFNYFKELRKRNRTVILVSHDTGSLVEFCNKGILIEGGRIISRGDISDVVNDYIDMLNDEGETKNRQELSGRSKEKRWGTGSITVEKITTKASSGGKKLLFTDDDNFIRVNAVYTAHEQIDSPVYGITVADASGNSIFTSNTMWANKPTGVIKKNERVRVEWEIPNVFNTGKYYISPAVADSYGSTIFDWRTDLSHFEVSKKLHTTAIINTRHRILINQ